MIRALPYLLALLAASPATAQERGREGRKGRGSEIRLNSLEVLEDIALPDEDRDEDGIAPLPDLGSMEGSTIARVTASDPPSGFDPVADASIPLGSILDRGIARKAAKRLWATGSYRSVRIEARPISSADVELVLFVEPMLRMKKLEVKGNDAMSDEDIERAVGYVPNGTILPTSESLIELRHRLRGAYDAIGYPEAQATLRLETTEDPGKVALVVEVVEGKPERYTRISLPGLPKDHPKRPLLRKIELKQGTPRNAEVVEEALEKLSSQLSSWGYLDSKIGKPAERRVGKYAFHLTIPIEPGIHTEVVFIGNRRLSQRTLLERLEDKGQLRSTPRGAQLAVERLRAIYREEGLFHARIDAGRVCRPREAPPSAVLASTPCPGGTGAQDLVFKIGEGPPVEVFDIVVEGNSDMTDEDIVEEIYAFMREKGAREDVFQRINTRTVDALGTSDPRPGRMVKPKGAITPTTEVARIYVPGLYRDVTEHLVGLYWERGFLEAAVKDTCRIEEQSPRRIGSEVFTPLGISRPPSGNEEEGDRPCLFIGPDLERIVVVVTVEEGPQTLLASVRVEGNDPDVFTETALLEEAGIKAGQPYNEFKLRQAATDMKALYQASGYMFVEVDWESSASEDGRLADVVFELQQGPQVRVDRIIVNTDYTSAVLIRDRLTLRPGDLITPEELSSSEQRLMELGIFDNATVQMALPQWPSPRKNIIVRVNEAKSQYLELRGGIATVEGLRGGFEYGYRNILGAGLNFRLRGRANYRVLFPGQALEDFEERYYAMPLGNRLERHILVGLSTPHVPGTRGILGLGIDGINERANEPAFSADRWSAFFRVRSSYLRFLPIELRTGLEHTKIELPSGVDTLSSDPRFQRWARMPEGQSSFWVTGLSISLDLRDQGFNSKPRNVFNPSRGIFLTAGADLVKSLANFEPVAVTDEEGNPVLDPDTGQQQYIDKMSNLIRLNATLSAYIPIYEDQVVLALSASFGYVFHLQSDSITWADRYFYMGGVETLRGFAEESLVPEDVYQDWKRQLGAYSDEASELLNSRGGESMVLARAELRFPLAKGFFGGVFGEAGNIWRNRDNIDPLKLRPVAGGGLRYMTPLGPISLDIGINLDKRPHEDRAAWFFSIGSAF